MQNVSLSSSLHINIPFVDEIKENPAYAELIKEIMSNKPENETLALTEECRAVIQRKLPPKRKDPGSFSIPITIGEVDFGRALCDLGASVSLMPLAVCTKLGLDEVTPTSISLQLADRSIKHPLGILENVLVKIKERKGKLYTGRFRHTEYGRGCGHATDSRKTFLGHGGCDYQCQRRETHVGDEHLELELGRTMSHPMSTVIE